MDKFYQDIIEGLKRDRKIWNKKNECKST
jgi:hypothetical protein